MGHYNTFSFVSFDEAFVDISDIRQLAEQIARQLQEKIWDELQEKFGKKVIDKGRPKVR